MATENMGTVVANEVSLDNLKKTLNAFNTLHRYTGSEQGEASVDYILDYCKEYGIPCKTVSYSCYRSLPIYACVKVDGVEIPALAAVYSGEAIDLTGELYFDELSKNEPKFELENRARYANFKGKIVLTYCRTGGFALKAAEAGAIAVINVWNLPDEYLHHLTIGEVWGNPTLRNKHLHTFIPFCGIAHTVGENLMQRAKKEKVTATLNIKMDTHIVTSRMPIIDIPAATETEKFVLASGHYDSWYEGITDNATSNAAMLECARVIYNHKDLLKRNFRMAFWSGHSDGRYAGSAWYVDNNWEDLNKNCVAHINLDLIGGKNDEFMLRGTNLMEKEGLNEDIIEEFSGFHPVLDRGLGRAGDESFSLVGVPLSMLSRFTTKLDGEYAAYANAYAPWWHSASDTIDKVDDDFLMRDTKCNAKVMWEVLQSDMIPVDVYRFWNRMNNILKGISDSCSLDFDMSPIFPRMDALKAALDRLFAAIEKYEIKDTDDIMKKVAGGMVHANYTYGSPFEPDNAYAGPSDFHLLKQVAGVTYENTSPETYLMLRTEFTRQRTRLCVELSNIVEVIDNQIFHWEHA